MQRAARIPPLPIARGEGPWLEDYEGRRYFDATSSWWVNFFGHSDARLGRALKEQVDILRHVILAACTHAPAVEFAERRAHLRRSAIVSTRATVRRLVQIALKMSSSTGAILVSVRSASSCAPESAEGWQGDVSGD
jgi:adenosylmethionine-8-amino-7-oxononanoate aminotransferase